MIPAIHRRSPFTVSSSRMHATRTEVRLAILNVLLVLAGAVLLYFVVGSAGRSSEGRQQEVLALEAEHKALQSRVADLRNLTLRVQSATTTSQEFATGNFLGRTNAFSTMIKNLEELAVKNRLHPTGITYDLKDETNELGWTGVQVKLALEGEYTDLVRFVNSVEKSSIFWIIRGLDVTGDPATGLHLNLAAETYLLPQG
jgi:Tfp pilus assembly protein PilO